MPSPTPDDPLLCPNSNTAQYDNREARYPIMPGEVWQVCDHCKRALKARPKNPLLRMHRVRSRNTESLDKVRDALAGITWQEQQQGYENEMARSR